MPPDNRQVSSQLGALADARKVRRWAVWTIEIGFGVVLIAIISLLGRTLVGGFLNGIVGAASAFFTLLRVDPLATSWSMALALGRIGLAIVPSVLLIRAVPRHRRVWLATALGMLALFTTPVSLTACPTAGRWLALAALSALASVLVHVRFLRWTVVLPYAILLEVIPSHGLLSFADVGTRDPRYRDQLLTECARNDGIRPPNLTADRLQPYHGISAVAGDFVFLAGEGPYDGAMYGNTGGRRVGSWWLRRNDGGFEFELPSEATGNLWRGCPIGETIWMARAGRLVGVKRLPEGSSRHEEVYSVSIPSSDMDLIESACDAERGRVFATEFFGGGVWEVPIDGSQPRRHEIGGVLLVAEWRFDRRLILADSSSLLVYAPDESRIVERVPARLGGHGFDVCPATGAAAVADLSGRLRVFELDRDGRYRFAWGASMFAPRRVAYSADCSRIGVTSADDHRVFIVDAETRRVTDVFRAGPALREVAPTGPREFSVSDVCSVTTFRW